MNKRPVTRTLLISLSLLLFIACTYLPAGLRWETQMLQRMSPLLPERQLERVSVAAIVYDDDSYQHFGNELFSNNLLAQLVNKLAADGAATIALGLPLNYAQTAPELASFRATLAERDKGLRQELNTWANRLDPDLNLKDAINRANNVVLFAPMITPRGTPEKTILPSSYYVADLEERNTLSSTLRDALLLSGAPATTAPVLPQSQFLAASKSLGFSRLHTTLGGNYLLFADGNRLLPGFALTAYSHFKGIGLQTIRLTGSHAMVGNSTFSTGPEYLYVPYPRLKGRGDSGASWSLARYLNGANTANTIKGKLVLVALDENAQFTAAIPHWNMGLGAQTLQRMLTSMTSGQQIDLPDWFLLGERLLLLACALLLYLLPRRLSMRLAITLALLLAAALINTWLGALVLQNLWLPLSLPLAFLLSTTGLLLVQGAVAQRMLDLTGQIIEARASLARSLQSQGQLDQALDELKKCPPRPALCEPLYQLALELERRRFFAKAMQVYDDIAAINPGFRDIVSRRQSIEAVPAQVAARKNNGAATVISTMVANSKTMEKPMLGRYRIERELGHGAMGVVYLGEDPKIGRRVAIKTLSLIDEFDAEDLAEVKQRFFREAEAAGRLDHPNIITIYDAGEEHDLAYIAMDYAPGASLETYAREDHLLPPRTVLAIAAEVASALEYAHERNVVHRDIKPSNIIYDAKTDSVKVTDFGIAFLADDSKTKTGLILGSPSYMSPEQVAGKKLDGRSDLYSLGVTVFQLLTGELPFVGDSLANLMYKITNNKAPSVASLRKNSATCVNRLVAKALHKEPGKRFASGGEMADALRKCLSQLR